MPAIGYLAPNKIYNLGLNEWSIHLFNPLFYLQYGNILLHIVVSTTKIKVIWQQNCIKMNKYF